MPCDVGEKERRFNSLSSMWMDQAEMGKENRRIMAMAKKCDRCGKLHEHYPVANTHGIWNALVLSRTDKNGHTVENSNRMDLCPDCMIALRMFLDRVGISNTEGDNNAQN